jgi:hypothetical protein
MTSQDETRNQEHQASDLESYIVTWMDPEGTVHANQVYAPGRDEAIWRLALLMQASRPKLVKFIACAKASECDMCR